MSYYIVFFDKEYNIKKATKSASFPLVKDIVYLFKVLEKSELKNVEDLSMDIITEEDFEKIRTINKKEKDDINA